MMKRTFLTILMAVFLVSCGTESRDEAEEQVVPEVVKDSLSVIEGEFIYLADAAVLKGKDFVYGVELDSVAMDLVDKTTALKTDDFDLVPVKVRAKIIPNPKQEGWHEIVQIREILEIPENDQDEQESGSNEKEIEQP